MQKIFSLSRSLTCSLTCTLPLLLLCTPLAANAQTHSPAEPVLAGWQAYAQADAFAAADFVAVSKINQSWLGAYAPKQGTNHALSSLMLEAGAAKGAWRFGFERRAESAFSANKSSLDLYYLYKQKQRPSIDIDFSLDAQTKSWQSNGLAVGYRVIGAPSSQTQPIQAAGGTLDLKISAFLPSSIRQSSLSGTAHYATDNTLDFAAQYANQASNHSYPFMVGAQHATVGLSLSLAGQLPLSPQTLLSWQVRDVLSSIKVNQFPGYVRNYNSATSSVDAQGYINYAPTMTGQNSQTSFRTSIDPKLSLQLKHQLGTDLAGKSWEVFAGASHVSGVLMPTLGAAGLLGGTPFSASYNTRFKAFSLELKPKSWRLGFTTDSLSFAKAQTLGLVAAYARDF